MLATAFLLALTGIACITLKETSGENYFSFNLKVFVPLINPFTYFNAAGQNLVAHQQSNSQLAISFFSDFLFLHLTNFAIDNHTHYDLCKKESQQR